MQWAERLYLAARRAQRFIYLESQYLWLESFLGVDLRRIGWRSHHMLALLSELAAAAERGVIPALVLPDHPNCGRGFSDDGITWLRKRAPCADAAGRLHFFTLAPSAPHPENGRMRYRPIYVHAKVGVMDDSWATVGSANLNSCGMSHDAELVRWLDLAATRVKFQGLPARICWLGYGDRAKAGLLFNDLVKTGRAKAPIVIGRDHLDCGSVASPYRETEAMGGQLFLLRKGVKEQHLVRIT
jgi:hypothetical protein